SKWRAISYFRVVMVPKHA
ncbi:hypothetical protein WJX79_005433, partial [Trebouxia sp. C0005]